MTLKSLFSRDLIIFAHVMPWFGQSNHKDIGYDSADRKVIFSQCSKMQSLGIDGIIPDWYGFDDAQKHTHLSTLRIADECDRRGMKFCICIDDGAIDAYATTTPTQRAIDLVNYVISTFSITDSYLTINNRPLILFFGAMKYKIDWNLVRSLVRGNPAFIFRNKNGYNNLQSDGAFSWLSTAHDDNDPASLAYLYDFYGNIQTNKITIGSIYPGFYDPNPKDPTKSVWNINNPVRLIDRRDGITFLDTIKAVPSSVNIVQLVTWNDYEEGSQIENGIGQLVEKILNG